MEIIQEGIFGMMFNVGKKNVLGSMYYGQLIAYTASIYIKSKEEQSLYNSQKFQNISLNS